MRITRWINRYQSRRDPQDELRQRMRDLAGSRLHTIFVRPRLHSLASELATVVGGDRFRQTAQHSMGDCVMNA